MKKRMILPPLSSVSCSLDSKYSPKSSPLSSSLSCQKSPKSPHENLPLSLPPLVTHQPIFLLENYKIFWRIHKTALISIYYHLNCEYFEIISTLVTEDEEREDKGSEDGAGNEDIRLYVSLKSIVPLIENTSELQLVKLHRWDLVDRTMRKCAAEYIFGILDSDADGLLRLTKYDGLYFINHLDPHCLPLAFLSGRENVLFDLHVHQPASLTPVVIERSRLM
jgi:hypothetical protein